MSLFRAVSGGSAARTFEMRRLLRRVAPVSRQVSSFVVSPDVKNAVEAGEPVVALESTIISHGGLPYPRNLELALDLEMVVREEGGVPATCAVVEGVPHIGLSRGHLDAISTREDVMKASRRDLPYACGLGKFASTTVAGTMILAHAAGIRFFATGGIGGVHRGAEDSFDISADLLELSKTPVVVVSAGVKSILDITRTLEVLETHGVPVVSFRSDTFPEFFTHGTIPSPRRVESEEEIAKMVFSAGHSFGEPLSTGMVVAVPNPEPYQDPAELEKKIQEALTQADVDGVKGAAITPYILGAIEKMTGGDSLESNVALVKNNARLATRVAKEYSFLAKRMAGGTKVPPTTARKRGYCTSTTARSASRHVLVVGGAAVDSISKITVTNTIMHSSNPAVTRTSFGGVGRNIAERLGCLAREQEGSRVTVSFASVVARDAWGEALVQDLEKAGVDASRVKAVPVRALSDDEEAVAPEPVSTATYTAIHNSDGDLVVSAGDFSILKYFNEGDVEALRSSGALQGAAVVVVDGNFDPPVFASLAGAVDEIKASTGAQTPLLAFEPTSDHKCTLPIDAGHLLSSVDIVKPNLSELMIMLARAGAGGEDLEAANRQLAEGREVDIPTIEALAGAMLEQMSSDSDTEAKGKGKGKKHVIVSMGDRGVVWARTGGQVTHIPLGEYAVPPDSIQNSNGCGDAFCAGLMLDTAESGDVGEKGVRLGFEAATAQLLR